MSFEDGIGRELKALGEADLLRTPRSVSSAQGPELVVDGRRVLSFCSNNYLGLANHPALLEATKEGLEDAGLGAGASRLVSGTMSPHLQAEKALASFIGLPATLLFSTGYAANTGTIQALVDERDIIFSDELCHASLIDGCRLSRAHVLVYQHANPTHLGVLLAEHRGPYRRALVITDALFSMDGDLAPVAALRALADAHDAALMVDEAHSLGVLGPNGRGLCADRGVVPDVLVGTLGKAFGCAGAFVAAGEHTVAWLQNRARSYVYSTAPSPALSAAVTHAVPLVREADEARARLRAHSEALRAGLRNSNFSVSDHPTPIIPLIFGHARRTMEASAHCFERGLFVQGIRPPSVPEHTSRLRLTPMATHTEAHVQTALEILDSLPWR